MSKKFEIGDVVMLKSGGESMTVEGYDDADTPPRVVCIWSDKGKIQHGRFIEATLENVESGHGFSIG